MAPPGEPQTPVWRSRAFIQPLILTIVGVVASFAIYLAAVRAFNPPCPDASCGILHYEIQLLVSGAVLLFLPLAGLLITGGVVGNSSRDSGLAGRALLAGMAIVWLSLTVATMDAVLSMFTSIASLILIGLGFGVGRKVKKRPSP
jgi:lysylphosphatidylglycerol synthetase-like protein (DUF2156 family)